MEDRVPLKGIFVSLSGSMFIGGRALHPRFSAFGSAGPDAMARPRSPAIARHDAAPDFGLQVQLQKVVVAHRVVAPVEVDETWQTNMPAGATGRDCGNESRTQRFPERKPREGL